jgi:hypothetical protein
LTDKSIKENLGGEAEYLLVGKKIAYDAKTERRMRSEGGVTSAMHDLSDIHEGHSYTIGGGSRARTSKHQGCPRALL